MRHAGAAADVAVVGGGPSGLTTALLLARAGHRVSVFEREEGLGGLWACRLDEDGYFSSENSCKVYQPSYRTAPVLLEMLGTRWQDHFTPRHELRAHWLAPFVADCSYSDLAKLASAFLLHAAGLRSYRDVSVEEFLEKNAIGEHCRAWMRATALGGVTGTLRMTMWELFHRLGSNVTSILGKQDGVLLWNAQPPNAPDGFVSAWEAELARLGVTVHRGRGVSGLDRSSRGGVRLETDDGERHDVDAVFLAVPPPAMSTILSQSAPRIAAGFGHEPGKLATVLRESVYEHLGLSWFFDRPLPTDLPLGGHNVRRGWHPILVQHSQYDRYLRPPAITAVVGSISTSTTFRHPDLGTLASEHSPEELARILWDDERRIDPSLPEPIDTRVYGTSSATQIVHHGPLPIRATDDEVYLSTSLNGHAPYFTASLESAIQAGAAAAAAFDSRVERLEPGRARPAPRVPWRAAPARPAPSPATAAGAPTFFR